MNCKHCGNYFKYFLISCFSVSCIVFYILTNIEGFSVFLKQCAKTEIVSSATIGFNNNKHTIF